MIEIDGETHGTDAEQEYDRRREAYMRKLGWRTVRVTNLDVYRSLDGVMDMILAEVPSPPSLRSAPPPQAGEDD